MTRDKDPAIAVLRWCAACFGRPFSEPALRARLPETVDLNTHEGMLRGLRALGLTAEQQQARLSQIDPASLPCILWQVDAGPMVLTSLDRGARVLDPTDGEERRLPLSELRGRVEPFVIAVTVDDPDDVTTPAGHWFWSAVRACRGAWAQVVVASLLMNIMALALPLFIMNVYDKVIPNLSFVTLWTLTIGVLIALALDLALRLLRHQVLDTISRRVDLVAGATLFRHAMGIGLLDRPGGAGGLSSHLNDYEPVRDFFAAASFTAFVDLLFIGVFIAVMFVIVGPLGWVPTVAVLAVLTMALAARLPMRHAAQGVIRLAARRNQVKTEALDGAETVKTLGAEPAMQARWERVLAASARANGQSRFWAHVSTSFAQSAQQLVSVAIIVWGVFLVFDGSITIGALIAANILAGRALAPLGVIAQTVFRAEYAMRSLRELNAVMALPAETMGAPRSAMEIRHGALSFRDVSFTYPDAPVPAIRGLDLRVEPGESIALLGRVGSGKTTLGRLMAGLLPVSEGMIDIDGFALSQYDPAELRRAVGYLPQRPELFTGTLGDNLLMGHPKASQAEIERALTLSGLAGFVARSPRGLDHPVGERGDALSGGQTQALALARLLLRRPRVLILDEPSNAMDTEMERALRAGLETLRDEGVTLILLTHRQSLVDFADRVVVLDEGIKTHDGPRERITGKITRVRPGGRGA